MFSTNPTVNNLLLNNLFVLLVFYFVYYSMDAVDPNCFGEPLGPGTAFYFTLTTHSTVGYGDIGPKTGKAKLAVTIHLLCILLLGVNFYVSIFNEIEKHH